MKRHLNYYLHDGSGEFRIQLAGHLSQGNARDLEEAWRTASSTIDGKCLIVDLSHVTSIDVSGRELLDKWHAHGGPAGRHFLRSAGAHRSDAWRRINAPRSDPEPFHMPSLSSSDTMVSSSFCVSIPGDRGIAR